MSDDPTIEEIQQYSLDFDELCQRRHVMGSERYGPVKFMEVDTVEMAIEEIADMTNYLRYFYIKLRLMQKHFEGGSDEETPLGIEGWKKGT